MGNSSSFILKHGRRLINRYNAQNRALEFISKENRPSAPRHPITPSVETVEDTSQFQELQKKNKNLDEYLKDVYVRSYDKVLQDSHGTRNNPERPLPESREPKPNHPIFPEPEVEKGWCTITQISEFLVSHEEDPVKNNVAAIAKKYSLDEKKVENTIKYFSVFRIFDRTRDTIPKSNDNDEFQKLTEMMKEDGIPDWRAKRLEEKKNSGDSSDCCLPVKKAVKH